MFEDLGNILGPSKLEDLAEVLGRLNVRKQISAVVEARLHERLNWRSKEPNVWVYFDYPNLLVPDPSVGTGVWVSQVERRIRVVPHGESEMPAQIMTAICIKRALRRKKQGAQLKAQDLIPSTNMNQQGAST